MMKAQMRNQQVKLFGQAQIIYSQMNCLEVTLLLSIFLTIRVSQQIYLKMLRIDIKILYLRLCT